MAILNVNGTLDVEQSGALTVETGYTRYINPSEVRIYPEQAPPNVDPHRTSRRGLGIAWSNGGSSTKTVYASFVAPHAFTNGSIVCCFKRWQGNDSSFTTHCYTDVVSDGSALPLTTTPTNIGVALPSNDTTINVIIDTGFDSSQVGNTILVTFSIDGIDSGTEVVLHALWLEYVA